jgi:HrpA-like RNA helicase
LTFDFDHKLHQKMRNKMVQFTNHNGRENGQCCTNGVNGGSGTTIQYNNGTNGRHTNPVAAETRTGTQQGLPINRVRKRIIKLLKSDAPTMIFVGETASGKSTQIPQVFIYPLYWGVIIRYYAIIKQKTNFSLKS